MRMNLRRYDIVVSLMQNPIRSHFDILNAKDMQTPTDAVKEVRHKVMEDYRLFRHEN